MGQKKLKILGFIFARGGSKGVPKKNIRPLAGKPLIHYAIETAGKSRYIDTVFVSTDDPEIAAVAREAGAQVPFLRPDELSKDDSPEWAAWQHAVRALKEKGIDFDLFVSIPATSPLRTPEDIDRCIETILADERTDAVITASPARRHPSFNMVSVDDSGFVHIAAPVRKHVCRRQDTAPLYDMTTVAYVVRADFILDHERLFDGQIRMVLIPEERALDIDTKFDFKVAELLIRDQQNPGI